MKKYPLCTVFLTLILILFFVSPSCISVQKIDHEQELIKSCKPHHSSPCLAYGQYGEYSYNVYSHSVQVMSLNPDIAVLYADIFDIDKDGVFDSVWIIQKGVWKYHSSKKHPVLVNTAGHEILRDFVGLANLARKKSDGVRGAGWSF